MKQSSEIARDRNGRIVIFNYARGKIPIYPPRNHRVLYVVESDRLRDEELVKEQRHHDVVSSYLMG